MNKPSKQIIEESGVLSHLTKQLSAVEINEIGKHVDAKIAHINRPRNRFSRFLVKIASKIAVTDPRYR